MHENIPISINRVKQDLHWVLNSPGIMSEQYHYAFVSEIYGSANEGLKLSSEKDKKFCEQDLKRLSYEITSRKIKRLGYYYEHLCHFILKTNTLVEEMFLNQQIISNDHTYGELDQLYLNPYNNQWTHKELAVKFYLGLDEASRVREYTNWVGPNLKDRLDVKLARMTEHQLTLTRQPVVRAWLENKGIINLITITAQLQGYLFYPFLSACDSPVFCNVNHLRGVWITVSQIGQWSETLPDDTSVSYLEKLHWLSGVEKSVSKKDLQSSSGIGSTHIANYCHIVCDKIKLPAMFEINPPLEQDGFYISRVFIVDDDWPYAARKFCLES